MGKHGIVVGQGVWDRNLERWGGAARQGQWQERISKCDSCLEGRAHRTRLPLDTAVKGEGMWPTRTGWMAVGPVTGPSSRRGRERKEKGFNFLLGE